jgi:hypothetical protein
MSSHVIFNLDRKVLPTPLLEGPHTFFHITEEIRKIFNLQDIRIFGIKILEKYKATQCTAIAHFS